MFAAAAVAVALAACGPNDDVATTDTAAAYGTDTAVATGTVSRDMSEAGIMGLLAAANNSEIEAANVALEKATNAQVRDFAQRMKTDHSAMMQQGQQLTQQLNVTPVVPRDDDDLVEDHKDHMQTLSDAGDDFDKEYMDAQIKDHENTLDVIDDALNSTQNPQVRQLLEQARPKIQQHLDLAKQVKDQID
jgi:putative membrane protein